jgi:Fe-S cluster assembly protein SufD
MNAEVRHIKTNAELGLAEAFAAAKPALPGDSRISAARKAAFDSFATVGLPHRRIEAWRYTDLRNLMRDAKPLAAPPDAAAKAHARNAGQLLADAGCRRLVVVDGSFASDQSDFTDVENGLTIRSMAEALASGDTLVSDYLGKIIPADDPVLALNTALMGDGVVIRIAPGVALSRPLHLAFITTTEKPSAMFMRSLVVIEQGARATVIETHEGPDQSDYQVNAAMELVIGEDAQVDHVKVTCEGTAALHVGTLLANIGARANFNDFTFTVGSAVIRNQLYVQFAGEGAVAGIRGVNLLAGRQHADTTLVVDHTVRGCESRQLFKSVLDDESRAVFQGKITVRPDAQKTDARMMARTLLLSEAAEADSKPELEIFADDVQCGHGSTAGALDEELKFYLMARGIAAKDAESLLIQAFVGEAAETIVHEGVRDALMSATMAWLQERGRGNACGGE